MKHIYQYSIILLLLSACQGTNEEGAGLVQHYGVLREIMMELKLEANVDLADLSTNKNLYALGALEGLSGELMILDGKAYKTSIDEQGEKVTEHNLAGGASLLVAAQVAEWQEVPIGKAIENLGELEAEIKALAKQKGLDVNRPFPFMLTGMVTYLKSHVINAPGASERSHEAFKQSGVISEVREEESTILGFYSEQHRAVFTHHNSFMHAHVLTGAQPNVGHVDELKIEPGIILKLPKTW